MLGSVAGDMIGAPFEHHPTRGTEFDLFGPRSCFTYDTALTVATASALMGLGDFAAAYRYFGNLWPDAGYGGIFRRWLATPGSGPYGSFGNGSAMRVGPIGWAFDDVGQVLDWARRSASVTHDHPEGVKGARATALAILRFRQGDTVDEVRREIATRFEYDLDRTVVEIRPTYGFDVTCQGSVPESIICSLEARDWEDAVRLAVSLGGDADTQACIAGGIAEARFGGVPDEISQETRRRLDPVLLEVVDTLGRLLAPRGDA